MIRRSRSRLAIAGFLVVAAEVVDEAFADVKLTSREVNFGLALGEDLRHLVGEELSNVAGAIGSAKGDDVG